MANNDALFETIADYVLEHDIISEEAFETARYVLMDTVGCAILSLNYPQCTKLLGPVVPGTVVPNGVHVIGTPHVLDPVQAAFNLGTMIRWLDYNDTWLAAEWGHPSDNIGGILAVAEYVSAQNIENGDRALSINELLEAIIKAHEIQGILALDNSLNRVGFDHVLFVKVATTAVACQMLGGDKQTIINALSLAFTDNAPLRTYRHAPNTGSRKSWAAGDATSRGVRLAMMAMTGEMGYATALTAPQWGFEDVILNGKSLTLAQKLDCYVMENVLFKVAFPAEFHAQTAAECAMKLHPLVKDRIDDIARIDIFTQESAMRIIHKTGPLTNPADRDHSLEYITAIGLLYGDITADHYEDDVAQNPYIDQLREKMVTKENVQYTEDYLNPEKRSIANSMQIFFEDGSCTEQVFCEYPIGHRFRRQEVYPLLIEKFTHNMRTQFIPKRVKQIKDYFIDASTLRVMTVPQFVALFL